MFETKQFGIPQGGAPGFQPQQYGGAIGGYYPYQGGMDMTGMMNMMMQMMMLVVVIGVMMAAIKPLTKTMGAES
jgi:uncharacterized membrane protein